MWVWLNILNLWFLNNDLINLNIQPPTSITDGSDIVIFQIDYSVSVFNNSAV